MNPLQRLELSQAKSVHPDLVETVVKQVLEENPRTWKNHHCALSRDMGLIVCLHCGVPL